MPQEPEQTTTMAIFEGATIRQIWHDNEWYFSVVDVIAALTESDAPNKYWSAMKARIKTDSFILAVSNCIQLRLRALDDKEHPTDCSNLENLIPILQAVPATNRRGRNVGTSNQSGIYAIVNTITGERYIGSSISINSRFIQHRSLLRRGKHHATSLQLAWDKFGEETFQLLVLEEVANEMDLEALEQAYIIRERPGYNSTSVASNAIALPAVEDIRIHILLEALRKSSGASAKNAVLQDIQLAIDFGIIAPGPKFSLLAKATFAGVSKWESRAFLLNQR